MNRTMKITALIENTKPKSDKTLRVEHGLSLHIQYNNGQILFDTGMSEAFHENAAKLGIDIGDVDMGVISHHHYDHGGGLSQFLTANQKAKVYLRQCDDRKFHFKALGIINKEVGMDETLFGKYPDQIQFVHQFTEISPNVFIFTDIEKPYAQPKGNRHLFVRRGKNFLLDRFDHELIMVIQEEDGLVVFTGCAHSGLLNMIHTVNKKFPQTRIKAVLGGFHLVGIPLPILNTMIVNKKDIREIATTIPKYPVDKLYTGHCTGVKAFRLLKETLKDRLEYLPTGRSIEI